MTNITNVIYATKITLYRNAKNEGNILGKLGIKGPRCVFCRFPLRAETDENLVWETSPNPFNADKSAAAHCHISCANALRA